MSTDLKVLDDILVRSKFQKILDKKLNNDIKRLGIIFKTLNITYFYDTGTGKVMELDNISVNIMEKLFDDDYQVSSYDEFTKDIDICDIQKFVKGVETYNLLQAIKPKELYTLRHCEQLDKLLDSNIEQIILELTGKCNLRCKYCIYNDYYEYNRSFNSSDMTQEIAKKSLDYLKEHSGNRVAVTFYGGEPLIKFDLLKWCIEYSREIFKYRELSFSLTTNLTLVTEEIAEYLASVPNLNIVCSLDGNEEAHDAFRKKANGLGSFDEAFRGLKLLSKHFKESKYNKLSINGVLCPPYYYEDLDRKNEFFNSLDFLPENTGIQFVYPSDGTLGDMNKHIDELMNIPEYKDPLTNNVNPFWTWSKNKLDESHSIINNKNKLSAYSQLTSLLRVHKRFITDEVNEVYPFNGCCVPGSRRLYITTTGEFQICERVGTSPSIGNVDSGINKKIIKKYYVEDYAEKSIEHCSDCWAIKLCPVCYAERYTENGFTRGNHEVDCDYYREGVKNELLLYHSVLENDPQKLDELNEVEIH